MHHLYGASPEDRFYYLHLYNENYEMPPMPPDIEEGIVRGLYRFRAAPEPGPSRRATILFSGSAWVAAAEGQRLLAGRPHVAAELWSATSDKGLGEDALSARR